MDTVAARVAQMRAVASSLETNATYAADFHRAVEALARGLLVESFAEVPQIYAAELVNELPAVAAILRNRADAAEAADQGGAALFDSALPSLTGDLELGLGNRIGAKGSNTDLAEHFERLDFETLADPGGTYSQEYRGGFIVDGSDSVAAGRSLIQNLLLTTVDDSLIAHDEFQLISVNGGQSFILVLGGVTDLTDPHLGLNPDHRSVRDMDQYALPSAASTSIADNEYARMVRNGLLVAEVPFGADIAIVGHSFGADSALDLAADDDFNGGEFGFNVTHVVAAAYNTDSQLEHVPDRTEVLTLQNDRDVPVIVEKIGEAPSKFIQSARSLNPFGILSAVAEGGVALIVGTGDAVVDTGQYLGGAAVNGGSALFNAASDLSGYNGRFGTVGTVDWGDFDDIYLIEDGVNHPTDHQTVVVFEGGFAGAGHDPVNYVDHLGETTDRSTVDFFEHLADAGYTGTMDRWSIDVSVPR